MLGLSSRSGSSSAPKDKKTTQEGLAGKFFPLHVDDEWIYEFESGDQSLRQKVRVSDRQTHLGTSWFVVDFQILGQSTSFTRLLRTQQDMLISYNPSRLEETILVDFSSDSADRLNLSLGYVDQRNRTVTESGYTFEGCVVVTSGYVDAEIGTYAPGIGLIESEWFRGRKQLLCARIDGNEIVLSEV